MIIFLSTAGYNHFEVAEFLLENGADVNAQDKGGLIPLHNASSYGVSLFAFYRHQSGHTLMSVVGQTRLVHIWPAIVPRYTTL